MRKLFLGLAAAGLVASPVVAQVARDTAPIIDENGIEASTVGIGFALATITVAIFALSGDDNDEPVSA